MFSPMYVVGTFIKNQMAITVCVNFLIPYSVPLIDMTVFMPESCCFVAMALQHHLNLSIVIPPALFFSLSIALAIQFFCAST
jgi:hypothetical protein